MRKCFLSIAMLLAVASASAQVTVSEPEFINSYCILTSDSSYATLPKESGTIGKHQNKAKKWSKLIGGAANIAGAAGMIGIESSLLGTDDTKKAGYVSFSGHKYGQQSYLLTILASELEKGEYGVFYMSIISATAIPVGTFSVK